MPSSGVKRFLKKVVPKAMATESTMLPTMTAAITSESCHGGQSESAEYIGHLVEGAAYVYGHYSSQHNTQHDFTALAHSLQAGPEYRAVLMAPTMGLIRHMNRQMTNKTIAG